MAPPLGHPKAKKKLSASGGEEPLIPRPGDPGTRWWLRPQIPERSPNSKFSTIYTPLTGLPTLKYPSSKFAIFWQWHNILQPLSRYLSSTNR